jgi:hypothetical protein
MSDELNNYLLLSKNSRQALIRKAQDSSFGYLRRKESSRGQGDDYEQIVKSNLDRVFKLARNTSSTASKQVDSKPSGYSSSKVPKRELGKLAPIQERNPRVVNSILSNQVHRYYNPKTIRTFTSPLYRTMNIPTRNQIIRSAHVVRNFRSPGDMYKKSSPCPKQNLSITQVIDKRNINVKPKFTVQGTSARARAGSTYSSRQSLSMSPSNLNNTYSYSKSSLSTSPVRKRPSSIYPSNRTFQIHTVGPKAKVMSPPKPKPSSRTHVVYKLSRLTLRETLETPILRNNVSRKRLLV